MTRLEKIRQIIKETDINFSPYYDVIPKLIRERKYTKGIEIGVFCGGHAKAILDNSELKMLVGIDPYRLYEPGMPGFEDQRDFELLFVLTKNRLNYKGRYQHIREVSDKAYNQSLKGQVEQYDFVFIDGLHTYDQCKSDLENYGKLIKQGGVVAGHDIDHGTFPLLTKAIEDYAKEHDAKVTRCAFHSWYIDKHWSEVIKDTAFNEEEYLTNYPDVRQALIKGWFKTGYEHYQKYGRKEGRKCNLSKAVSELADDINPGISIHLEAWSNTLTLKGYKEKPRISNRELNIVKVSDEFKQIQSVEYPQGNKIPFERYFEKCFIEERPETLRKYLPIHWTSYYVNNKYGADKEAIKVLQKFIDTLLRDEKYFTIVQYDDGILNDVSGLDLLVYSMGCKKSGYYPIPLLSQPLCSSPFEKCEKDLLYSFIGANTHKIREQLVNELGEQQEGRVTLGNTTYERYIEDLKRSTFALCPRGYGITSFRMFEAMSFGCIPVYISDDFWEPFNIPFTEYGIKIRPEQIKDIPEILKSVDIPKMQKQVEYYFKEYFVYSSCYENIIKTLL